MKKKINCIYAKVYMKIILNQQNFAVKIKKKKKKIKNMYLMNQLFIIYIKSRI